MSKTQPNIQQVWVVHDPRGGSTNYSTRADAEAALARIQDERQWDNVAERVAPDEAGENYRAVIRNFIVLLLESRDNKWGNRAAILRVALQAEFDKRHSAP